MPARYCEKCKESTFHTAHRVDPNIKDLVKHTCIVCKNDVWFIRNDVEAKESNDADVGKDNRRRNGAHW